MKRRPAHRQKPYSPDQQINRMSDRWPDFDCRIDPQENIWWSGHLRGWQRVYKVGVFWDKVDRPYVFLIDPPLVPREGGEFDAIPHLIYRGSDPAGSGLCLYDPDGREWSTFNLIADTTIPWAMEWLYYYELWLYDGVWRGGGVGAESIAHARGEAVHRAAQEHKPVAEEEAPVASGQAIQNTLP